METRKKAIITFLLVAGVVAVLIFQAKNDNLFKGQLLGENEEEAENLSETAPNALPDLTASIRVIQPEGEDLELEVTISNLGPGSVTGKTSFVYNLFLNDTEIFSNSDSYTYMEPGDSFSFNYPVSKEIYNYPATGTAKIVVDSGNAIKEEDEENNEIEVGY